MTFLVEFINSKTQTLRIIGANPSDCWEKLIRQLGDKKSALVAKVKVLQ